MCADQNIPSINRIERLQSTLAAAEAGSEDGQDIFALDQGVVGSNDGVIANMNYITSTLDIHSVDENLLNQARIQIPYFLPSDYEGIFEHPGLSRRSERPFPNNDGGFAFGPVLFIQEWMEMCLEDRPKKKISSCLNNPKPTSRHRLVFVSGSRAMGTEQIVYEKLADAQYAATVAFVGEAEPGRLVWTPLTKYKSPFGVNRGLLREIGRTIKEAEAALVALARRIARYVATCVVYEYAAPLAESRGYAVLTRRQIGRAVREILGEEWFDLPFDVDGGLRNWSEDDVMKPDAEIEGEDIFIGA